MRKSTIVFTVAFLALPFGLYLLANLFISWGLLPLFFYSIYYLPLATWIGEPFFTPDSDLGFQVTLWGNLLTALVYFLVIWAADQLILAYHKRQAHRHA